MTMLDTDLGVLSVLSLLFYFPATLAQDATLRGCANSLLSNGTTFKLTNTDTFSQYIHCIYQFEDGNGGTLQNYHWYDYQNYTLYHYPNTQLPLDSHPACPTTLPLVSIYRIRTSVDSTKCVTSMGEYDGAPVQIQVCTPSLPRQSKKFRRMLLLYARISTIAARTSGVPSKSST
ncbi:hypothetical protein CC2G_009860 [Coprinopsis cinerea AmutBmut pab1-1]|nr:hypothetical protein CC2G_009860 [Coprinopsis cinerea AmutBmut pab1-1]